jgi:hypothetical protein
LHEESVSLGGRGDEPFGGGRLQSTVQHEPAVACDRDHVYLNLTPRESNNRSETIAWRWSDRAPVKVSDRGTVVLASAVEDWLLWAGNGKTHFTDRATGKTAELEGAGGLATQPQLSPDRRTVFLAGAPVQGSGSPPVPRRGPLASGRHGFWDTTKGNLLAPLPDGHEFSDFDATGRWAVLRDQARGVVVLDLPSGQSRRLELPLDPDRPPPQGVGGMEVRPTIQVRSDGARLAVSIHGAVHFWDMTTNRPVGQLKSAGHAGVVNAVAQHAGARRVASAGADQIIYLWDRGSDQLVKPLIEHKGPVTALAFHPREEALASASEDGSVILWRFDGTKRWSVQPGLVSALAFPSHGRFLACGTRDGRLLVLEPGDGKTLAELRADGSEVLAMAFGQGELLATGTARGQVTVWRPGEGEPLTRVRAWDAGSRVEALTWLPKRNVLLTGGNEVHFWEPRSGDEKPPCVWTLGGPRVRGLAVSESGRELYVADDGGQVARYDLRELGERLRQWGLDLQGLFD